MAEARPIEPSCAIFLPGHCVHWIQGKKSVEPEQPVIPVSLVVHDDGIVDIEGSDLKLTLWNHSPALLLSALNSWAGRAWWKPRFHVLVVPGPSGRAFNVARLDERTACKQRVRPREGDPVEEYILRAMREDGGYTIPASGLVPQDAANGSAHIG